MRRGGAARGGGKIISLSNLRPSKKKAEKGTRERVKIT